MAKAKATQPASGLNTGGRPRGPWKDKAWRDALRLAVLLPIGDERKGKTKLDGLALSVVKAGLAGDVTAIKEIGDRLDGKVPQALVGGDENDNPIRHVHRVELVDLKGGE